MRKFYSPEGEDLSGGINSASGQLTPLEEGLDATNKKEETANENDAVKQES